MNLHQIVSGAVGTVNKFSPLTIQVSTGSTADASGRQIQTYATPGSMVASISGTTLTVASISEGTLQIGQALADLTSDLTPGTLITALGSGTGGVGTYTVNNSQTVASEAMTTSFMAFGDVQNLTYRDLQQLDGLNLQGTRRKIYVNGHIYGVVRATNKGGDLITDKNGLVWLTAMVLEHWQGWTSVAATLQNGS